MTAPSAHWLPRADGGDGRGELLRRSFEDRLQRRDEDGTAAVVVEGIERLRLAELERLAALRALADLPDEVRALLAEVLGLPPDVQRALAALLD